MISKWAGISTVSGALGIFFVKLDNQNKEKVNGTVLEALPDTTFKVRLEDGRELLAYLAGRMRINYIKVMIGDRVTVEVSPDGTRGRIVFRH